MRVTRTHVNEVLTVNAVVQLPEDVVVHLGRVLRLQPGDPCVLFNGDGQDYSARIEHLGKRDGTVRITDRTPVQRESPLKITLIQSIARGEKMDWILQKSTELGVSAIVPVNSQRSEVKLAGERAAKRVAHWREVIISACEQSGRAVVPALSAPVDLKALTVSAPLRLILDPLATGGVRDLDLTGIEEIAIAIGPEGGWSELDLVQLAAMGFAGMQLGPRVLRTETAGLAAVSALQCVFGDF